MLTQPTGNSSLADRQRYLRRRRTTGASRGVAAAWVGATALLCWLFIAGVSGLGH